MSNSDFTIPYNEAMASAREADRAATELAADDPGRGVAYGLASIGYALAAVAAAIDNADHARPMR